MNKRYLFFASHAYAYEILRPLQTEIHRRGDVAAWYLEKTCPDLLRPDERRLRTIAEVETFAPLAVFAPGNWIYDFLPGIKVAVFHGYPMHKRAEKKDDHFTLRGWFDIYCTQGPSSTPAFKALEHRHRYFKVYETGWCKVDPFFALPAGTQPHNGTPTLLYAPTFSRGISSAWALLPVIARLACEKPWRWIVTFHPKLDDPALIRSYEALARRHPNITFPRHNDGLPTFRQTDAMLCDSSSIIVEYMLLDKPVVTYRNTHPGDHLLNVVRPEDVGPALERALARPPRLMEAIRRYTAQHEAHRDGHNAARVLDAVDDFAVRFRGRLRPKPLNLFRKLKLRWRLGLWRKL